MSELRDILPPTVCPKCESEVTFDGTWFKCSNGNCPAKLMGRIYKWRSNLDIKFLGDEMVKHLVDLEKVKSVLDLYYLTSEDICRIPRMGVNHFKKMKKHLKTELTWAEILGSLSIDHLALKTAELFVKEYKIKSYNDLVQAIADEAKFHKMGPTKSGYIVDGLVFNLDLIKDLITGPIKLKVVNENTDAKFYGKSFVFTGAMENKRSDLQKIAKDNGAEIPSSINSSVTHLVCSDPNSGSSKMTKARKLGIEIISEQKFLNM